MKFISSKTIKCLVILAFVSSGLSLLGASNQVLEGKVIEIAEEEDGAYKSSSYLKYPNAIGN